MKTYIIRRKNIDGKYVHLDTFPDSDYEITEEWMASKYGPGHYNVLYAVKGERGLKKYGTFIVVPGIEFLEFLQKRPSSKEIEDVYGPGMYMVSKMSRGKVYPIFEDEEFTEEDIEVMDVMETFSPAMNGFVLFKVIDKRIHGIQKN